jgi:hypothetical protein
MQLLLQLVVEEREWRELGLTCPRWGCIGDRSASGQGSMVRVELLLLPCTSRPGSPAIYPSMGGSRKTGEVGKRETGRLAGGAV